jgi:hypothetical protein
VNKGRRVKAQGQEHTYGVDIVVLEQRTHHGVNDHRGWDLQCLELQRGQSKKIGEK